MDNIKSPKELSEDEKKELIENREKLLSITSEIGKKIKDLRSAKENGTAEPDVDDKIKQYNEWLIEYLKYDTRYSVQDYEKFDSEKRSWNSILSYRGKKVNRKDALGEISKLQKTIIDLNLELKDLEKALKELEDIGFSFDIDEQKAKISAKENEIRDKKAEIVKIAEEQLGIKSSDRVSQFRLAVTSKYEQFRSDETSKKNLKQSKYEKSLGENGKEPDEDVEKFYKDELRRLDAEIERLQTKFDDELEADRKKRESLQEQVEKLRAEIDAIGFGKKVGNVENLEEEETKLKKEIRELSKKINPIENELELNKRYRAELVDAHKKQKVITKDNNREEARQLFYEQEALKYLYNYYSELEKKETTETTETAEEPISGEENPQEPIEGSSSEDNKPTDSANTDIVQMNVQFSNELKTLKRKAQEITNNSKNDEIEKIFEDIENEYNNIYKNIETVDDAIKFQAEVINLDLQKRLEDALKPIGDAISTDADEKDVSEFKKDIKEKIFDKFGKTPEPVKDESEKVFSENIEKLKEFLKEITGEENTGAIEEFLKTAKETYDGIEKGNEDNEIDKKMEKLYDELQTLYGKVGLKENEEDNKKKAYSNVLMLKVFSSFSKKADKEQDDKKAVETAIEDLNNAIEAAYFTPKIDESSFSKRIDESSVQALKEKIEKYLDGDNNISEPINPEEFIKIKDGFWSSSRFLLSASNFMRSTPLDAFEKPEIKTKSEPETIITGDDDRNNPGDKGGNNPNDEKIVLDEYKKVFEKEYPEKKTDIDTVFQKIENLWEYREILPNIKDIIKSWILDKLNLTLSSRFANDSIREAIEKVSDFFAGESTSEIQEDTKNDIEKFVLAYREVIKRLEDVDKEFLNQNQIGMKKILFECLIDNNIEAFENKLKEFDRFEKEINEIWQKYYGKELFDKAKDESELSSTEPTPEDSKKGTGEGKGSEENDENKGKSLSDIITDYIDTISKVLKRDLKEDDKEELLFRINRIQVMYKKKAILSNNELSYEKILEEKWVEKIKGTMDECKITSYEPIIKSLMPGQFIDDKLFDGYYDYYSGYHHQYDKITLETKRDTQKGKGIGNASEMPDLFKKFLEAKAVEDAVSDVKSFLDQKVNPESYTGEKGLAARFRAMEADFKGMQTVMKKSDSIIESFEALISKKHRTGKLIEILRDELNNIENGTIHPISQNEQLTVIMASAIEKRKREYFEKYCKKFEEAHEINGSKQHDGKVKCLGKAIQLVIDTMRKKPEETTFKFECSQEEYKYRSVINGEIETIVSKDNIVELDYEELISQLFVNQKIQERFKELEKEKESKKSDDGR